MGRSRSYSVVIDHISLFVLLGLHVASSFAQSNSDSLLTIWNHESEHDTVRVDALISLAKGYRFTHPDSTYYYAKLGLELAERSWLQKRKGILLDNMANARIGAGAYFEALDLHQESMRISEQLNDRSGVAISLNQIGWIHLKMGDPEVAKKDFETCLKIQEELGDSMEIGGALINIGNYHMDQKNSPEALGYFQRSAEIFTNIGLDRGVALALNNIGVILGDQGDRSGALDHYQRSMAIYQRIGNLRRVAGIRNNIGLLKHEMGNNSMAITECAAALELATDVGDMVEQKYSCECLYLAYKALGQDRSALEFHERISAIDDSMKFEETAEKLKLIEFEKQMLKDSLQHEVRELKGELVQQQDLASKERTRDILVGLAVLLVIVAGGLFSRMRYIKRTNASLAAKNDRQSAS